MEALTNNEQQHSADDQATAEMIYRQSKTAEELAELIGPRTTTVVMNASRYRAVFAQFAQVTL